MNSIAHIVGKTLKQGSDMKVEFWLNSKAYDEVIKSYNNFIKEAEDDDEDREYWEKILSEFEENTNTPKAVDIPFRPMVGDFVDTEWLGLHISDAFIVEQIYISDSIITARLRQRNIND